jgi:hypothetical protein
MVEILRGEFAKSCEPLDIAEVQGRYSGVFPTWFKLRREFNGEKARNICIRIRNIVNSKMPME